MYNNPYIPAFNTQASIDRINNQMAELEKMKQQLQQQPVQPQMPTNLTQNFQIAPTNHDVIKYAGSIEEVQRDMVIGDTPYFSKDLSVLWIKNTKGDIKSYELKEIVQKDEKDLLIDALMLQIEELKGKINNEQYVTNDDTELNESSTSKDDGAIRTTVKENKSPSVSRISKSTSK